MSRIGRLPITIPASVKVDLSGSSVVVKGPKGEMKRTFSPLIDIAMENGQITIARRSDNPAERALHGTTRAVLNNMVRGVSTGFVRTLEWDGVGYRAELSGATLMLYMGYSHPVKFEPPQGISFEVDAKTRQIRVLGFDKEVVGQTAAEFVKSARWNPTWAKACTIWARKSAVKPVSLGKGRSNLWLRILVLRLAKSVTCGFARKYLGPLIALA